MYPYRGTEWTLTRGRLDCRARNSGCCLVSRLA
jgi:hypothetical protein